ncbi:MAG TPA: response regulator transcription factor [Lacunisphaera sp.]|nr:response regulator transcription factor [Lacunisphaera sp.]
MESQVSTHASEQATLKRVVIVDDHYMIVEMIAEIFERWEGFKVVGHAASCKEALEICHRERPDFVILDVGLPDASGLEAFKKLKAAFPAVHVLVFSGNLNAAVIKKAMVAGVDGILSKASPTADLRAAIRSVSAGQTYLCNQTSETVRQIVRARAAPPVEVPELSKREKTVLRHIASGLSSKEIAAKLGLSRYTINNFRAKLSKKTGLHRAVQLSRYAAEIGLLNDTGGTAHPW